MQHVKGGKMIAEIIKNIKHPTVIEYTSKGRNEKKGNVYTFALLPLAAISELLRLTKITNKSFLEKSLFLAAMPSAFILILASLDKFLD